MEKVINRQKVLLQHLQPISNSSSSPETTHESADLSVSLFLFYSQPASLLFISFVFEGCD